MNKLRYKKALLIIHFIKMNNVPEEIEVSFVNSVNTGGQLPDFVSSVMIGQMLNGGLDIFLPHVKKNQRVQAKIHYKRIACDVAWGILKDFFVHDIFKYVIFDYVRYDEFRYKCDGHMLGDGIILSYSSL
jgi:hypothetical protein